MPLLPFLNACICESDCVQSLLGDVPCGPSCACGDGGGGMSRSSSGVGSVAGGAACSVLQLTTNLSAGSSKDPLPIMELSCFP